MTYPRVVIIGETFHSKAGGGITLSNLFKDWPEGHIGVITDRISETDPSSKHLYYQLGWDEIRYPFPFSKIQTYTKSGTYSFTNSVRIDEVKANSSHSRTKLLKALHKYLDKVLELTGLSPSFYSIRLSDNLRKWILEFRPDIIYIQPFQTRTMVFGNIIHKELHIPYGIHIMDDSISYNNKSLILRGRLQRYMENQFTLLVTNASIRLCISEAMAAEYFKRYGKTFLHFRNPVDLETWRPFQKKNLKCDHRHLKIVYTGRLYSPTFFSLIDICRVIHELNNTYQKVELDIYSYDKNKRFYNKITGLRGINLHKPVQVKEMPALVSKYDVYFLCLDFDEKAQKYAKYSISTKTAEGMISGVPVLVYA
ncbi:hypothetical protein EG832_13330, partial [bacterium]|nr:hypothetical protein [bacterium]